MSSGRRKAESIVRATEDVPRDAPCIEAFDEDSHLAHAAAESAEGDLPAKPILTIESGRRWVGLDLPDAGWSANSPTLFEFHATPNSRYKSVLNSATISSLARAN